MSLRTGLGFDVHAFEEGRDLILGGIKIPFQYGLAGHSDADVLLHAIADALLGSLALGDIGLHFPDSSEKFLGADSRELLKTCYRMVLERGFIIENLDAVLILENPKLRPYIDSMRNNIAEVLECNPDQVSVKATTTEKLGFTGRGEGIAAQAMVLIRKVSSDD